MAAQGNKVRKAIRGLLDRPGLRAALGNAGRRYVLEHYTCGAVSRRLMAALDGGAA